ncbi:SAF domain-containing protein [Bacillus sp. S17B2]|uniref:SAF domain-containing protein n=1 Tax=Bacillus sp. S17B2 TaxID=2918907 RepID=UPI002281EB0D|nr:SAF domain-containing protein [Bacillus sp. S17B2]
MKQGAKITASVALAVVTIAAIPVYDFFIKDRLGTEQVLVVKEGQTVQKSDVLDNNNLVIQRRPKDQIPDGAITADQADKIAGKKASAVISGNSVLSKDIVDFDDLVPDKKKDEAIRPLTEDMLFAKPGSLRRNDTVNIYALTETQWGKVHHEEDNTSGDGSKTAKSTSLTDADIQNSNDPILKGVKVAYVKDSSNKEVQSSTEDGGEATASKQKQSNSDRLNATSTISELEVILSEKDFQKLMTQTVGEGKKLYITYQ